MKNIQNWEDFNVNEGVSDVIKSVLSPLKHMLSKFAIGTIKIETLFRGVKGAFIEDYELSLFRNGSKDIDSLTPNKKREMINKIKKFDKMYPNGFSLSKVKKETVDYFEKFLREEKNEKRIEDYKWIIKQIKDFKVETK